MKQAEANDVNIITKKLNDACVIEFGTRVVNKKDGGSIYPVYGGGGATFKMDTYNRENCLVVSRFAMSKRCTRFVEGKFYLNDSGLTIKPKNKEELAQEYLDYLLLSLNDTIYSLSRGTAQRNLNVTKFRILEIKYPESIELQLHIANLLSKAENLISQRKESIHLLDEFLKSTFLEMFGDPVRNEKGFNKCRFGDFINEIVAGSSYGGEQNEFLQDDEFGVLKVSAVTWGVFNPKEFKVINKKDIKREIINPAKGDLLFSRANTRELVGATCIVDKDYPKLFLPDKLWNLKLNECELNKVFVHFLFQNKSFKNILTREASGTSGSMLNISMEKLRNLKFPKPPLSLQTQFAQTVEKTEALKTQYQKSLSELENLYGSLSQKAFKGELSIKNHANP